jgi:hypothetical protein
LRLHFASPACSTSKNGRRHGWSYFPDWVITCHLCSHSVMVRNRLTGRTQLSISRPILATRQQERLAHERSFQLEAYEFVPGLVRPWRLATWQLLWRSIGSIDLGPKIYADTDPESEKKVRQIRAASGVKSSVPKSQRPNPSSPSPVFFVFVYANPPKAHVQTSPHATLSMHPRGVQCAVTQYSQECAYSYSHGSRLRRTTADGPPGFPPSQHSG